jgi:hypothetical protein
MTDQTEVTEPTEVEETVKDSEVEETVQTPQPEEEPVHPYVMPPEEGGDVEEGVEGSSSDDGGSEGELGDGS